jgi:hypothetical protein
MAGYQEVRADTGDNNNNDNTNHLLAMELAFEFVYQSPKPHLCL